MLTLLVGLVGVVLIGTALFDALETIVVPRRVSRRLRVSRLFYWSTWTPYARIARTISNGARRETFLSFFGPFSLLLLVALWAVILILGFASIQWAVSATAKDQPRNNRCIFRATQGGVGGHNSSPRETRLYECG